MHSEASRPFFLGRKISYLPQEEEILSFPVIPRHILPVSTNRHMKYTRFPTSSLGKRVRISQARLTHAGIPWVMERSVAQKWVSDLVRLKAPK